MPYDPNSLLGDVKMNPVPKPAIEVHIKRSSHDVGCTTVAAIIAKALKDAGMTEIRVKCADDDFHTVSSGALNECGTIIDNQTCRTVVTIVDENEYIDGSSRGSK